MSRASAVLVALVALAAPAAPVARAAPRPAPAAPATAAGKSAPRIAAQLERLFDRWQIEEASLLVAALPKEMLESPRLLGARAELLFLGGDYPGALALLTRLPAPGPRQRSLRALVEATLEVVKGYVEFRSPQGHFRIHTTPGKDEILAPFAAETLEAIRSAIAEDLGFAPADPIRVEIYPGVETLSKVSTLSATEIERTGTIALCKYNRLMIVTPRALLRGYSWQDTLAHEYIHLAVSRLSQNGVPVWIHEGLAKHFEARWRLPAGAPPPLSPSQEHLLAEALRTGRFIAWERMHPSMAKLPNQQAAALAFAQVQTVVDFIAKSGKGAPLRKLIEELQAGRSDTLAIARVTDLDERRFEKAWRGYLRSMGLRRLTGLVPPELSFGKPLTKEQRLAAVRELKAQGFLRLADMMRTRNLTRAAILEYEKARSLLGLRDDLVANHLARAYLEISSPAQAIAALLPVLEYYPEFPGPQVTMGLAYLKSGDDSLAEQHLRFALRVNPFDPEIHCGLAQALKTREPKQAQRHAGLCARLSP
jgi:tetratricopeptide (TPR) repeat protein